MEAEYLVGVLEWILANFDPVKRPNRLTYCDTFKSSMLVIEACAESCSAGVCAV